jgi:hypothetical protein
MLPGFGLRFRLGHHAAKHVQEGLGIDLGRRRGRGQLRLECGKQIGQRRESSHGAGNCRSEAKWEFSVFQWIARSGGAKKLPDPGVAAGNWRPMIPGAATNSDI